MTDRAKVSAAFVKAQAEIRNPAATARANYGNYAPLERIVDDARAVLSKHGLAFAQEATSHELGIGITTHILHESGESLSFGPLVLPPTKNDAQAAGSAITYGRRYALCAVLGIAADEDDDGQKAAGATQGATSTGRTPNAPAPASTSAAATPESKPASTRTGASEGTADTGEGSTPKLGSGGVDLTPDTEQLWQDVLELPGVDGSIPKAFGRINSANATRFIKSQTDDVTAEHLRRTLEVAKG